MPAPSRQSFGGRKAHQKNRKSGSKPRGTGPKGSKRKRGSESRQSKQKNQAAGSPRSNNSPLKTSTILSLPVPAEESTWEAKLGEIKALNARWKSENMTNLEGKELVARHRQRCKDVGLIIFGFTLQEAQVDARYTLFYEQKDLLLLAKTGFSKSLIFQLLPIIYDPTAVVILLMPLKLLQAEQNSMIN